MTLIPSTGGKFAGLFRTSSGIYHLSDPKQPDNIFVYEGAQLDRCIAFDAYLRATEGSILSVPPAVPAGYLDLAKVFNEQNDGPERFSTLRRQEDGSVKVSIDGPPVHRELLGFESDSALEASEEHILAPTGSPDDVHIDTYVMVEMPTNHANQRICERITKVKELAHDLNKFYLARALIEEEFSLRLSKLREMMSAHQLDDTPVSLPVPTELNASVLTLLREIDSQSTTHRKLAADIQADVLSAETRLAANDHELRKVLHSTETLPTSLYEPKDEQDDADAVPTPQDKEFVDNFTVVQEKNMDIIKEVMWSFANHISTACVADDETCEVVRVALEKFEPSEEAMKYTFGGTALLPKDPVAPPRTPATPSDPAVPVHPELPPSVPVLAPPKFLFHVRALYSYEATETGDLSFEKGDVAGILEISDGGWWKAELLISAGRGNIGLLPSNFVTTTNAEVPNDQ